MLKLFWCLHEQAVEETVELPDTWDTMNLMWRHCIEICNHMITTVPGNYILIVRGALTTDALELKHQAIGTHRFGSTITVWTDFFFFICNCYIYCDQH